MPARIDKVTTSGIFSLDGGNFEVENNVWLIGDDSEVLVVDAAHEAAPIARAVDGRTVVGIVCTHGHNDHINVARDLWDVVKAPIHLHGADRMLWDTVYPDASPDLELVADGELSVAGTTVHILNTPGHSPGSCCLYVPDLGVLFSGDTLFQGGPGATGRSYSDFPTIVDSIATQLLTLPEETVVHTGHGDDTTIGAEAPSLEEWRSRGR